MEWQLLTAHLNSFGSGENKFPDNAYPTGPSLLVTLLLRRHVLLWGGRALSALLIEGV